MWNKRGLEIGPEENQRTEPAVIPRREMAANTAVIGASMRITGEIYSQEPIHVDGEVDGKLELGQSLSVGPTGKVRANIKAKDVTILGTVKGDVEVVEKIAIRDHGSLIGNIKTAGIVIDDGAYFKGSIDIIRNAAVAKGD